MDGNMEKKVLEMRIPLDPLAPTAVGAWRHEAHRKEREKSSRCAQFGAQRMALSEETGLLAIANGRVVDLYAANSITTAIATNQQPPSVSEELHLPSAGQIVLGDHLDAYLPDHHDCAAYATCVALVAPSFLLVAVATADGSTWLCGFRMYSRSVAISHRYGTSSLLIHCAFADPISGVDAVASLEPVATECFTSQEAGAVLMLFHGGSSPSFAVFQWAERFSDRVLSVARLPTSDAPLTAIAAASDGRWIAVADTRGAVSVLDFRWFVWEARRKVDFPAARTGKRLVLRESFRLGRLCERDHALDSVRFVCEARAGAAGAFGSSLRWWTHDKGKRSSRYLLVGQSDGALMIMHLNKIRDPDNGQSLGLKPVEIYPAIRALKDEPVVFISTPADTLTNMVEFSTITKSSWRRWIVEKRFPGVEEDVRWPTLTDSLGEWTYNFSIPVVLNSRFLARNTNVANHLANLLVSNSCKITQWLFVLTPDSIRVFGNMDGRSPHQDFPCSSTAFEPSNQLEDTLPFDNSIKIAESRQGEVSIVADGECDGPAVHKSGTVLETLQDRDFRWDLAPTIIEESPNDNGRVQQAPRHYGPTCRSSPHKSPQAAKLFPCLHQRGAGAHDVHRRQARAASTIIDTAPKRLVRRSRMQMEAETLHHPIINGDNNATEVIPHVKEKYDPDHPDADWGGYVQRGYKKKAEYSEHSATRQNLVADPNGGIVPDRAAPVASSSFSGKKLFDPNQVPAGDPCFPGIQFQSAVYQVGSGADLSCSNWKTSYAAQTSLETTPKEVFAVGTRNNSQQKRHVIPMYEKAANSSSRCTNRVSSPSTFVGNTIEADSRGSSPSGLVGSESTGSLSGRRYEPRRSLLAGIGKLVAADDLNDKLVRPEHHLSQGYTDPTRKTLVVENHHNITLGYTGRKSSFR